jgi:hypothetical protein
MPASTATKTEPTQQDVCIDLPGETVQCWRSSDNIKVILRKHRDIIFDLNLGKGKDYTVESTGSDFYNARDKKLVYAKRRQAVIFRDGERLHLWVTRAFQGSLVLKCGNETLMKLTPNEVDRHRYDDMPKTKPAPIIVALGSSSSNSPPNSPPVKKLAASQGTMPTPSTAPMGEECSIVCVVEAAVTGAPTRLDELLKKGGGKSGWADIDPFEVATRNWILGQLAGTGAYAKDNWEWLRACIDNRTHQGFKLVTAKIHYVRGRARIYFSGYSQYNAVFGRGGFSPAHDRIVNIFAGVGKTASSFTAAAKGVAGSFKGNALISFIFGTATAIAEWHEDLKKDGYDLAAALVLSVLKAIVSAALTVAIVAVIMLLVMLLFGAALPLLLVGATTIAAGFASNYLVEAADKKLGHSAIGSPANGDGLAGVLAPILRDAPTKIESNWEILIRKYPSDYVGISF